VVDLGSVANYLLKQRGTPGEERGWLERAAAAAAAAEPAAAVLRPAIASAEPAAAVQATPPL
jgi:hypothetical protein